MGIYQQLWKLCTQVIPHGPPIPSAIRSSAAMTRCCTCANIWRVFLHIVMQYHTMVPKPQTNWQLRPIVVHRWCWNTTFEIIFIQVHWPLGTGKKVPHFCHIPTSCQDFTEEASVVRWMDLVLYGHQWKATRSHLGHFGTSIYFPETLTDLIGFRNSLVMGLGIFCTFALPPTVLKSCPSSVANDRRRVESSLPHLQTRRGGRIISNRSAEAWMSKSRCAASSGRSGAKM